MSRRPILRENRPIGTVYRGHRDFRWCGGVGSAEDARPQKAQEGAGVQGPLEARGCKGYRRCGEWKVQETNSGERLQLDGDGLRREMVRSLL